MAKLADCESLDDAQHMLTRAEKPAVLGDARGLQELQKVAGL